MNTLFIKNALQSIDGNATGERTTLYSGEWRVESGELSDF